MSNNIRKDLDKKSIEKRLTKKRVIIYLSLVYALILFSWIYLANLPNRFLFFSFIPLLSNLLTRILTKDNSKLMIKPNFCKNWKIYLTSAFLPSVIIFLSAILFFLIFPNNLDLSAANLAEMYGPFGFPKNLPHTVNSIIKIGIVGILISPFIIPVLIFAFGEEIGWRGYLLPNLMKLMNQKKAVLLSGALWGIAHAPLIYLGLNYGMDYWLFPYSGILMMTFVCVVLSVWLSYVTIKTNSVIPASILHGSINVIGEWPSLVATPGIIALIGPNPTGVLGIIGFVIVAIIILKKSIKLSRV